MECSAFIIFGLVAGAVLALAASSKNFGANLAFLFGGVLFGALFGHAALGGLQGLVLVTAMGVGLLVVGWLRIHQKYKQVSKKCKQDTTLSLFEHRKIEEVAAEAGVEFDKLRDKVNRRIVELMAERPEFRDKIPVLLQSFRVDAMKKSRDLAFADSRASETFVKWFKRQSPERRSFMENLEIQVLAQIRREEDYS